MLFFIGVLIALSVLILVHEWGHFFAARRFKVLVKEFGFGFPPRLFSWTPFDKARGKKGETTYSFNALPLGGYVRLFGENEIPEGVDEALRARSFTVQSAWKRMVILVAGVCMNIVLGWIILSMVFMMGTQSGVGIVQVLPDSPADRAGFVAGDVVKGYTRADAFLEDIARNAGALWSVEVMRDGETIPLVLEPRVEVKEGEGRIGAGILEFGIPRASFFEAFAKGFFATLSIAGMIALTLYELIKGILGFGAVPGDIAGPVGIFTAAYGASSLGLVYVMQLIGIISINLGVLNLLPIPGLDGGRLLFVLIEKIRGKRVSLRREAMIHGIGVTALIILIIIVTFRDVARLF